MVTEVAPNSVKTAKHLLSTYSVPNRPCTGIHDRKYARAVATSLEQLPTELEKSHKQLKHCVTEDVRGRLMRA